MNQENWQKAKEIFNEALTLGAKERAMYLDAVCQRDPLLGEQVKGLLESYKSGFLEDTAIHEVAEILGSGLRAGQKIGHYEIRELLGTGGMGEVYLAEDLELKRLVAIKILHPEIAADRERTNRFIQEARAASALNHPNILTIHEIGTFENSRFIVSEFVNGETLRERLKRESLTVKESLEICEQVAAALNAAHKAGIVHRDVKPENLMIRDDGLVKVLDFGLAKLVGLGNADLGFGNEERETLKLIPSDNPQSAIRNPKLTSPGLVMGTAAYMSPEQARGKAVDQRTDLWSLGVVLYEMLTGKQPFAGETASDIIASILKTEAESLESLGKPIPKELESICVKALVKDANKRYQTAREFLEDLRGEKKRMESVMEQAVIKPFNVISEQATKPIRIPPTLSAEYLVTSVKRHKWAVFSSFLLLTVLAVGVTFYNFNAAPQPGKFNGAVQPVIDAETNEKDLKFSRFSASGRVFDIAISPDGKYIAYVTGENGVAGRVSIRLQQTTGSSDVEIVPPVSAGLTDLSFTPDGNYLYYYYSTPDKGIIYKIPALGGSPTKIAERTEGGAAVETGASVSPDGKTIAFQRVIDRFNREESGAGLLVLANPDGSNERILVKTPPNWVDSIYCSGIPAWSPDGKTIACFREFTNKTDANKSYINIIGINVFDGSQQILSEQKWSRTGGAVWLPDGNLIVIGKEQSDEPAGPQQIWLVAPNAAPKRVTNDLTGYSRLSATARGDRLVTVQPREARDLWIVPENDASRAKQITFSGEVSGGTNWMPDGKLAFSSIVTGNNDIWTMNADGTNRKQLTANQGRNIFPTVSPDGRYIVFMSNRANLNNQIYRMDADGNNVKQLTSGNFDRAPRISPDGKWVYYNHVKREDLKEICKIPIDGGEPVILASVITRSENLSISPQGLIAYEQNDLETGGSRKVLIISPEGGPPIKTLELPSTSRGSFFRWTPDGLSIAFGDSRDNFTNLWSIPVDGSKKEKPLTNFTNDGTGYFDWSPDGKQLLLIRVSRSSNGVIISRAE